MFIYDLTIFLTSTAFVNTKAKYGIPLSRYTVFLQNCPLERRSKVVVFLLTHKKLVAALDKAQLGIAQFVRDPRLPRDLKVKDPLVADLAQGPYDLVKINRSVIKGHPMLVGHAVVIGDMKRLQSRARLQDKIAVSLYRQVQVPRIKADAELLASHTLDHIQKLLCAFVDQLGALRGAQAEIFKADGDIPALDILGDLL